MDPNVNSPLGAWKASPLWRRTQQPSDTDLCHLLIVLSTKSSFSESREVQWYESSRLPGELRSPRRKLAAFWSRNRLEMGQPVTTFSLKRCWWMESDGQWAVTGYEFMCNVGPSATGISGPKEGRNIPTKDVEVDIALSVFQGKRPAFLKQGGHHLHSPPGSVLKKIEPKKQVVFLLFTSAIPWLPAQVGFT